MCIRDSEWSVPVFQITKLFSTVAVKADGWDLLECLFGENWDEKLKSHKSDYKYWFKIRSDLVYERPSFPFHDLEQICASLCEIIRGVASYGMKQNFKHDGLEAIDSRGLMANQSSKLMDDETQVEKTDQLSKNLELRWLKFQENLKSISDANADSALR